jgi:hypothetical protein
MRVAVIAVTLAVIGSSLVQAESLGEVAAREREKKKNKAGSGRVLTESDLAKRGTRGNYNNPDEATAPPSDATTAVAPGEKPKDAPKEKTADEVRAEAQDAWKKRYEAKNKEIADLQAKIAEMETRPIYMDAGAQANLQKLKDQLTAAQQALSQMDDERRRNGFR